MCHPPAPAVVLLPVSAGAGVHAIRFHMLVWCVWVVYICWCVWHALPLVVVVLLLLWVLAKGQSCW